MTLLCFSERLSELAGDESKAFSDYVSGMFSAGALNDSLNRKDAARLIHLFLYMILGENDLDWGEYAELKDIYECRICANAIAQVCVKGIMVPAEENIFGGLTEVSDEEAEELIGKVSERR